MSGLMPVSMISTLHVMDPACPPRVPHAQRRTCTKLLEAKSGGFNSLLSGCSCLNMLHAGAMTISHMLMSARSA